MSNLKRSDLNFKNNHLNSTTCTVKTESRKNSFEIPEEDKVLTTELPPIHDKIQANGHLKGHDRKSSIGNTFDPSYPGISPEVARYLCQMNPDVVSKVEAALTPDTKKAEEKVSIPGLAKSNLAYLATSDAFVLPQSVIGGKTNLNATKMAGVHEKPTLFQSITDTNRKNENQITKPPNSDSSPTLNDKPSTIVYKTSSDEVFNDKVPFTKTLHKFPADRITTVTERKPSWFTSDSSSMDSPSLVLHKPPMSKQRRSSTSSRRSSLSSTISSAAENIPTQRVNETFPKNDSPIPNAKPVFSSRKSNDSQSVCSVESAYSDKYELDSNYSDLLETQSIASNMSEMSSVSGIEEEMYRIKKLLLEVPSLPDDHPDFHKRSVVLGRTGGIIMSNDCGEAEQFVVSQEVFFELQREKANLEGQLETLKTQLDELVKDKGNLQTELSTAQMQVKVQTTECQKEKSEREKFASKLQFMQQMNKKSEGSNAQLQVTLESTMTDLAQLKDVMRDLEECNSRIKIESEELRVDLESKDGAVQGLKSKIAELHVEAQLATQAKIQAINDQQLLKSEMEALQKSREWYQQQLHSLQDTRNKLQQEFLTLQGVTVSQKNEIEKLRIENVHSKQFLMDTQQRAVKEKETLMRHLESIKADMLEREAAFAQLQSDRGTVEESLMNRMKNIQEEKSKFTDVTLMVSDLEEQVSRSKAEIAAKNEALKSLEVHFAETMKRLTIAEKTVNERDLEIQRGEEKLTQLDQKLKEMQMSLHSKDEQVNTLQSAKTAIEIALAAANKEKREIDEAMQTVRANLVKLNANFKKMKADLANRDMTIEQLLREKNKLEENVMSSEQKIIALRSNYENYSCELKSRDEVIMNSEESQKNLMQELKTEKQRLVGLEEQLVKVKNEKISVAKECVQLKEEIAKIKEAFKNTRAEKKETESQLEKLLASALASSQVNSEDSGENRNSSTSSTANSTGRVRRNSQDLSDGTKILRKSSEGQVMESYPRDALEREILLMRQALETREKQIEKFLQDKNAMLRTIETLQKENTTLNRELSADFKKENDEEQLSHQIEFQLEVYKKKVKELEHVLQLTGAQKRSVEIETQTDNVSFMKHVLEQDDHKSVEQSRFENLELEYRERQRIYDSNIKVLTRKLKEVMKAHKKAEVELKNWRISVAMNQTNAQGQGDIGANEKPVEQIQVITAPDVKPNEKSERNLKREILQYRAKVKGLQIKLKDSQAKYEEMKKRVETNKEAMLELERERGKLTGINQSNEVLKSHTQRLESALAERDVAVTQLDIAQKDLTYKQEEEEMKNKHRIEELEINLSAERETCKELRKQIFNAKRESSGLRKQVISLRTGLDSANQQMETKKKEIDSLIEKLEQKKEVEMKLINQYELLGGEYRRALSEIERLKQQAIESQTKDTLLAEQMKNFSWHLRQKNQELTALKEQMQLVEERYKTSIEGLQKSLQAMKTETQGIKDELDVTRRDKFNYQTTITELKAALKSSIDANKTLNAHKNKQMDANMLDLPIPESPLPYDETLINSLLEQSAFSPQSRPLSDLQSCLNTLKVEMAILQEQLNEQDIL